ncbi:MAG TPA: MFS transporter [Planctomycetota bacterium]|nr:MFS transporter [Planctomycetota bacterium]
MGNEKRLLSAGFMAILAAGVGFAVRGAIFGNWAGEFGFTNTELGAIGGAGFTGFCFGIVIGGMLADKFGYGKLVMLAFALHVISAIVTFAATGATHDATEVAKAAAKASGYNFLFWGMFLFAYANGTLEAVANPLVATLFPKNRTHYLNILHASWPAGLVLGGMVGWIFGGSWSWKVQLGTYLIPTLLYGVMFFGQKMPKSEASEKGLSLSEMFKDVGILGGLVACFLLALFFSGVFANILGGFMKPDPTDPDKISRLGNILGYGVGGALLIGVGVMTKFSKGSVLLFVLFCTHALVGAVELGTDGWIQNITGNILTPKQGNMLLVWTSLIMFSLRFCAHFIENKLGLSPVGILVVSAILACIGLNLSSNVNSFGMALAALAVYALGKTFFWPTMLAVASDRFPKTGAIAISFMGGIGMMSAGLIGGPGLGYAKDRFSAEELGRVNQAAYEQIKSKDAKDFLVFGKVNGFDGTKMDEVKGRLAKAREGDVTTEVAMSKLNATDRQIIEAGIVGDRKTLRADSAIPAIMALIYLGILAYFKSIGGYKALSIAGDAAPEPAKTG